MNKNLLVLLSLITLSFGAFSQDDEVGESMISNGTFENSNTKTLKRMGGLDEYCENWFSATDYPADLFAKGVKSDKVSAPMNDYGKQEPLSGEIYAGFRAYSKDRKLSRSYIEIEFKDELEKNKQYCFKFNISLADLSKYAVDNIGIYISERKIEQPNMGTIAKKPQIMDKSNKVMMVADGWETICGTFVASGQEQYMVIGCFERDDELEIEKMKRPSGIVGAQTYHAYYYVDDVEVYEVQAKSQCECGAVGSSEPDLIYSKSILIDKNMTPADRVRNSDIYYAYLDASLNAIAKRDLAKLIKVLKENPDLKVEVVGHCDNDEFDEGKINPRYRDLGQKRAERVVEYLKDQGISEMRLVPRSKENTEPANTRPTPLSRAQNRRVVFVPK